MHQLNEMLHVLDHGRNIEQLLVVQSAGSSATADAPPALRGGWSWILRADGGDSLMILWGQLQEVFEVDSKWIGAKPQIFLRIQTPLRITLAPFFLPTHLQVFTRICGELVAVFLPSLPFSCTIFFVSLFLSDVFPMFSMSSPLWLKVKKKKKKKNNADMLRINAVIIAKALTYHVTPV